MIIAEVIFQIGIIAGAVFSTGLVHHVVGETVIFE
jgi:hypothetical protein